jgi:hypothetical protein
MWNNVQKLRPLKLEFSHAGNRFKLFGGMNSKRTRVEVLSERNQNKLGICTFFSHAKMFNGVESKVEKKVRIHPN